jgi:soluble cytochrome b562
MFSRRLFAVTAFVLGFAVAAVAFDDDSDSPLHRTMEGLKKHMKPLNQLIADPAKNAESLQHLVEMQGLVLEAKKYEPPSATALKDDAKAKHLNEYQIEMTKLLVEVATMELDVRAGDNAKAQASIKARLVKMRDAGHDKFQGEAEGEGGK